MTMVSMIWEKEMSKMLTAFEHQAFQSLVNIKWELNRNRLEFNPTFKQYFLHASNARLVETYNRFEIHSRIEDQMMDQRDANIAQNTTSYQIKNDSTQFGDRLRISGPFQEIVLLDTDDSSDDGSNLELDGHAAAIDELDDKMSSFQSNMVESRGSFPVSDYRNETEHVVKRENMELDGIPRNEVEVNQENGAAENVLQSLARKSLPSNPLKMKKHKCTLCEYSSNYKGDVNRHMRTHTGERPYRCDICSKESTTMQSLKKHKVTHINEIPFHCRGCFKAFSQMADRDAHEKAYANAQRRKTIPMRDLYGAFYGKI
ncbi:zinc finger protein 271-like [Contarinia nasturtii]|uniref:zinc finger protein 271-like n=1 Tax=Contarinia nasturtii TaxID=265458 RepID=UPI0012D481C7|nr:zinc finger protein 271-like [Contarinia nasturtii]